MLRPLKKYNLKYEKAIIYANDQLNCNYPLSKELLKELNFENGQFFTLLPEDADLNRIYDFFCGLILPQNEICEVINELTGEKSYYTRVPTLDNEIANFIFEALTHNEISVCIFEDVQQELTSPHLEFFHEFGFSCLNKIYYFMNKENASRDEIINALGESNAIWHQLCILTQVNYYNTPGQEVTLEIINHFAKNIQLMILGAYDGEGYFFWEPYNQLENYSQVENTSNLKR